ncbi:MAG TPA: outer membrane lipid asymmetry maintenance protein MlaD [Acetobacteraceae bacterium]|jgi:phospholipid/cholesterol/gamma-HCH transport system substrate-binding protein|nr:outer membrane lipid asymmetry maintenance protein MlaD [Acetobacteraceae bacterium]
MPRRNFAEVLVGAVVLLVAAGFLAYAVYHSGRAPSGGYQLYAKFDHIGALTVGSDVRMAGVKVGSVDSTMLDPKTYQAVVGFTVASDVVLPKDSSATIAAEGLLGGDYLSLSPGGDEAMLRPGQTITITQGAINIEELLGKFIFSASNLASSVQGGAGQGSNAGNAGAGAGSAGQGSGPSGGGLPPRGAKSP